MKVPAPRTSQTGTKGCKRSVATAKQRLSAIRSPFAFLKEGGVLDEDSGRG
jgi:hypothetical protein